MTPQLNYFCYVDIRVEVIIVNLCCHGSWFMIMNKLGSTSSLQKSVYLFSISNQTILTNINLILDQMTQTILPLAFLKWELIWHHCSGCCKLKLNLLITEW